MISYFRLQRYYQVFLDWVLVKRGFYGTGNKGNALIGN
ncbi:hypothetical protein LEP1GSC016_2594 [Leptospira borgpetersenii serovar Hardjo-bovis str. Sponselee]|uniref:Uncharacterized protein n=2 Tax=Leptospira borgpetersenii TaxID=174 RepID=M6BZ57_LEPBO|nr:hypothetical protein LEP1GSC016_2594 [Leptospira borgpetersenii serovar Hardjo-bovis str. Sponselee]EMO64692.1 hypothetical protein LEP1GSC133_2919 [Leptospira borgpetersenii serovar Pomona str. 200901868]